MLNGRNSCFGTAHVLLLAPKPKQLSKMSPPLSAESVSERELCLGRNLSCVLSNVELMLPPSLLLGLAPSTQAERG